MAPFRVAKSCLVGKGLSKAESALDPALRLPGVFRADQSSDLQYSTEVVILSLVGPGLRVGDDSRVQSRRELRWEPGARLH